MNRSLEVLKSIYKPYRYTLKGKVTLLETTSGDFIIKPKKKEIPELYTYLVSRGFDNFPKLIDGARKDVNVYEYISDTSMPLEQKCTDLVDVIASLHNKTSYFKEVSEDTYKEIYEGIDGNIAYLKNYYDTFYERHFNEVYMRPSTYLFMRNFTKVTAALDFCKNELDEWYKLVKDEKKTRVAVVHNNLELNHFIKNGKDYLISWDNYKIDTPLLDIVNLYKKEYLSINFEETLARYFTLYPLLEHEKKLLFILITLPPVICDKDKELSKCKEMRRILDYIFKTEELIRPYYAKEEE